MRTNGILVLFLIAIFLIGCAEKPTQPGKTPKDIRITGPSSSVYSGGTLQLSVTATFVDGTTGDVTTEVSWSNDPGRAGTIQPGGIFVAENDLTGIETVRAVFQGQVAMMRIEVTKRAISLSILPVTVTIESGSVLQFEAVAEFQDASKEYITDRVEWRIAPGLAGSIDSTGCFRSRSGSTGLELVTGHFQKLSIESRVWVRELLQIPFEMVTIPAGHFIMGDDSSQWNNEKPAHEVYTDAFEIGKYEVTNEQYVKYLNAALEAGEIMVNSVVVTGRKGPFSWMDYMRLSGTSAFPDRHIAYDEIAPNIYEFRVNPGFEKVPVVRLTWYGATVFCLYYGLRLPTEAEWERACRGGQQLEYGTQDGSINRGLAKYSDVNAQENTYPFTPVGSFPPNPYGLFDMSGNAAEYVFDLYDRNYYSVSPAENPAGPGPVSLLEISHLDMAVWRGGSGLIPRQFCRSAFRGYMKCLENTSLPSYAFVGFRVARSLD